MNSFATLKEVLTPRQMQLFELLGPPSIFAGEDVERYCRFAAAIFKMVRPKDVQDFIYQRDLIDLEWDVLRYRVIKAQMITNAKDEPFARDAFNSAANEDAALTARVVSKMIPQLRQLDLMIESAEIRRDRAYRELERRRTNLVKQLRNAASEQAETEVANDDAARKAA
jgi:hypothetical protein